MSDESRVIQCQFLFILFYLFETGLAIVQIGLELEILLHETLKSCDCLCPGQLCSIFPTEHSW